MRSFFISTIAATAFAGKGVDYRQNGADWPGLCQTGKEQSPIDIQWVVNAPKMNIGLSGYQNFETGVMTDLGATLQFNTLAENKEATMTLMRADGETTEWKPLQFHFHAPSEHAIGGQLFDLEVHFVHLPEGGPDPDGQGFAAVLGVIFDRLAGGDECNPFIDSLKFNENTEEWEVEDVNVKDFLDTINTDIFMSYDGSLTTPPCTEGVKWSLLL